MNGILPAGFELRCSGCNTVVDDPTVSACPQRLDGDNIDHRLEVPETMLTSFEGAGTDRLNPFVAYRRRFYSYRLARRMGLTDEDYVGIVEGLDQAVAQVDGRGFQRTPLREQPSLAAACRFPPALRLWVKDETGNVSGSHKARHLMGLMIHQHVLEATGFGPSSPRPLAIASCGNAALGAAVVARAAGRSLLVFVPEWVAGPTRQRLVALGATVNECPRQPGRPGDPCYHHYRAAIDDGAVAFAAQASEHALTLEGGATLGYELAEDLDPIDAVFVQVGGGALGAAVALGLRRAALAGPKPVPPAIWAVQAANVHPLRRALRQTLALVLPEVRSGRPITELVDQALDRLARERNQAMVAWEGEPHSIATGILDDETYDWRPLIRAILNSANDLARRYSGIDVDPTGTAGLAGLMARHASGESLSGNIVVLFTGANRASRGHGAT